MRWWGGAVVVLVGCAAEDDCAGLPNGAWTVDGSKIGMEMHAVLTMDEATCTFTFSDWDMAMANLPDGGAITGDEIVMMGEGWATCEGAPSDDGSAVTGSCGDGTDFSMVYDGATMTSPTSMGS